MSSVKVKQDDQAIQLKTVQDSEQGTIHLAFSSTNKELISTYDSGCYGPETMIVMADYSKKYVSELVKGDEVKTRHGSGKVVCLVSSDYKGYVYNVDKDVWLTDWHPFRVKGFKKWMVPNHISNLTFRKCMCWCMYKTFPVTRKMINSTVYSLVLDNNGKMLVSDNLEFVVLCHNMQGPVVNHPFFGTLLCVQSLFKFPSFLTGHVKINGYKRNPSTGLVNMFI